MTPLFIGLAVVFGLVLLVLLYWAILDTLFPEKLSTNEVFLVSTQDLWQIRMCRYRKGRTGGQPVLLVHGANANQYNFTVPEGISLVAYLVERGYDCWTVDLRGCRSSVPPFERNRGQVSTDDFLNDDIPTAIRYIQQETGYARIHYVGHSLGGMLLYAYALKFGTDAIASGVTLGAPLGFEGLSPHRSPLLFKLAGLYPALSGIVIRGFIPFVSFFRINPGMFPTNMRNIAKTMNTGHFYRMLEDPLPGVLDDLSRWVNHSGWRMDEDNLNVLDGLNQLDFPLFALYAPLDPFVSISKAREFFEALPSADKRMLECSKEKGFKNDYNHCDLAFGHNGAREIFGPIARWFETHSIRERMPIDAPNIAAGFQSPLRATERADILSGNSYAHLSDSDLSPVSRSESESLPPQKKASARKKSAAGESKTAKTTSVEKRKVAKTKSARRKAPTRSTKGGPDLSAASAALNTLGPSPKKSRIDRQAIRVKPGASPKKTAKETNGVETPKSVLEALSNASDVLGDLKKPGK